MHSWKQPAIGACGNSADDGQNLSNGDISCSSWSIFVHPAEIRGSHLKFTRNGCSAPDFTACVCSPSWASLAMATWHLYTLSLGFWLHVHPLSLMSVHPLACIVGKGAGEGKDSDISEGSFWHRYGDEVGCVVDVPVGLCSQVVRTRIFLFVLF